MTQSAAFVGEKGTTMASASDTQAYPIWKGTDEQLYCDNSKLINHITCILHYNLKDGQRLTSQIVESLNRDEELQLAESEMQIETMKTIIHSIHPNQRFQSLAIGMDDTIVHEYIKLQRNDIVTLIFDSLSEQECYEILLMEGLLRKTALHLACEEGNTNALDIIHGHVDHDQWLDLLLMEDACNATPLHYAADLGHTAVVKFICQSLNAENWYNLVKTKTDVTGTVVHLAAKGGHTEILNTVYESVTTNQWYYLLRMRDSKSCTPLHWAAFEGKSQIVAFISKAVKAKLFWYNLLQIGTNVRHETPLHYAAVQHHPDIVQMIHQSINAEQWYELLQKKNSDGYTTYHTASLLGHFDVVMTIKNSVTIKTFVNLVSALVTEWEQIIQQKKHKTQAVCRYQNALNFLREHCRMDATEKVNRMLAIAGMS